MWNWNFKKKEEKTKNPFCSEFENETESYKKLILTTKEVSESNQQNIAAIIIAGKVDEKSKGLKKGDVAHIQGTPLSLSQLLLDVALKDDSGSFGGIILSVAQILKIRDPKMDELGKALEDESDKTKKDKTTLGIDFSKLDLKNMSEKEIIELGKRIASK